MMKMEDYTLRKTIVVSKNSCLYQTLLVIRRHSETKTITDGFGLLIT